MPVSLIVTIILASVVILSLAVLFQSKPEFRKTVVFLGSSLGVVAAAVGSILAFFELKDSTNQHRQSVRLQRQEIAFSYMKRFHDMPNKAMLRGIINSLEGKRPEEVQHFFATQRADGMILADVLNFFEETSVAVRTSYADEATLCALLEEPVVRYYGTLAKWVNYYRRSGKAKPYLINYEWLYGRWRDGCPDHAAG